MTLRVVGLQQTLSGFWKFASNVAFFFRKFGGLIHTGPTHANVNDIEPLTSPLEKIAKTRADAVTAENRKEEFLERAPKSNEDYFLVPRVVE